MAKRSETGWACMPPSMPRTCHGCGGKLTFTRASGAKWFDTGALLSWHWACAPLIQKRVAA